MVCPRCIAAVEVLFSNLGIPCKSVELGTVKIPIELNQTQRTRLAQELSKQGFELLADDNHILISKIKTLVIDQIHQEQRPLRVNYSTHISDVLKKDYTHLSRIFSMGEGRTLESYIISQKIERAKELLKYQNTRIGDIAEELGYTSIAHFSAQFKKSTGLSPTAYKKTSDLKRTGIDQL